MHLCKALHIASWAGLLALAASAANATPVFLSNASFEDPAQPVGQFLSGAPTGWTIANGNTTAGVWNPNLSGAGYPNIYYNAAPPDGNQGLALGFNFSSGEVSQDLGVTLQPDTTYTLNYWVGQRLDYAMSSYDVELLAGSVVLAADHQGNPSPGGWVQRAITFNSGSMSGGDLVIDILGTGRNYADGVPGQADFDLIQLDATANTATPEPNSAALIGCGLSALAFFRYRRN
jgi:hypothetical protein